MSNPHGTNQNGVGPTFWTDKVVAVLRERWAAGDSAGVIADAIGTSRNSIIGKVRRLKLEPRKVKTALSCYDGRPVKKAAPKPRKPHVSIATRWGAYSAEPKPGKLPPTPVADLVPLNIPFEDLRAFHCRWMTSETTYPSTFCGHSAFVGSWCPTHRAIVSAPKPVRRKVDVEV